MSLKSHPCPNSSLKVSLISRHFGTLGGLEKYGYRLAKAFKKRGAHVTIVTSDSVKKNKLHPLIHFQFLPVKKWLNFRQMKAFDDTCRKWHQSQHFDVIFGMDRTRCQTHIRAGNGVHLAYLKQLAKIDNQLHSLKIRLNPLNRTILKIEKEAFESAELKILFTNSHMVKQEILTYYKTPPEKIKVIHNGVEWKEMKEDFHQWVEKKRGVCRHLGLNPSRYHFLFVGNGYKRKGLTFLLKALNLLSFTDFHLSVVGKDRSINHFIELSQALGLKEHVTFFGPQLDMRPFYQYADSLVIPSLYDPFANVTLEALAMGLYIVTSKTNGGHEILNPENGILIEDLFNSNAFAQALQVATERPKTWIGSQNIRNSVEHLDFSNQLTPLIDLTLKRA